MYFFINKLVQRNCGNEKINKIKIIEFLFLFTKKNQSSEGCRLFIFI